MFHDISPRAYNIAIINCEKGVFRNMRKEQEKKNNEFSEFLFC